jgi:hypothetical protein
MSLIRLLTTTRSLRDVKNEPSPYRMSEQAVLPKFGPRGKARGDARPPNEGPRDKANAARRDASPYQQSGASGTKENLGEGNGDRTDAGCSLKSESGRKPEGLAGWWQRLFRRQPRRERREPVQAEFPLDLVKVVRNDLSDADAEQAKPEKRELKLEHQPAEETAFSVPVR